LQVIVPAPMLTLSPIVESPRYARCIDFDPAPSARLLQFDEIPHMRAFGQLRAHAQPRERPGVRRWLPDFDEETIENGNTSDAVLQHGIMHDRTGADAAILADDSGCP
jgi:hypothetical protein